MSIHVKLIDTPRWPASFASALMPTCDNGTRVARQRLGSDDVGGGARCRARRIAVMARVGGPDHDQHDEGHDRPAQ